ncbi:uncharacterized protein TNCV_4371671 [Trichonephila clavipes]|nr:uncharacterized protein TNCV_4371671 [Trichonephila clavipes]
MMTDGAVVVNNIEKLFKETRQNTRNKHEKWVKYYNRRKHEVNIKVNDFVLAETHPISSASKKASAKFKPKFEGPYRVLNVQNNNVVIWKRRKGRFSQIGSRKEDQVHTSSGAEETSPEKPVPDLQEEQCKPRRDQPDRSRRDQFRRPSPYHFRHRRQSRQGLQEP